MTHVMGGYYKDSRNCEVFHVPLVFVLIEPPNEPTETIFEPRKLKSRLQGLRRVVANGIQDVEIVRVHENDIKKIISLCFSNKDEKAEAYCQKVYCRMIEALSAYYQESSKEDYDSRIMEDIL